MGNGPNKEKINHLLEQSESHPDLNNRKIEYKYDETKSVDIEEINENNQNSENNEDDDFFDFDIDINFSITNPKLDVKNVKKFPYITIGTISVIYPLDEKEEFHYTCFLIYKNVVVTLATNIFNENKGGKAISIKTTFSDKNVKWENVYIQNKDNDNNLLSKLAVILYDESISNQWIGVEQGKKEDFDGRDIYAVFSIGFKEKDNTNKDQKEENKDKIAEHALKEIFISNFNPFLDIYNKGTENEKELIIHSLGSPLYYKDYNNGVYAIAIINENYEFQYFDRETMLFLNDMIKKGKLLRTKKPIDEDNIIQLELQENDLGPLDMKYLAEFNLINLRILDLSSNSIKAKGVFYLSQAKFNFLESLNLNFNKIGDEGLKYISNGSFTKLNSLYLFHNNISFEGIKYLVKSEFINSLIILSLSENPKIGDIGIKIMKDHKGWNKLNTLNLNYCGLTDISLTYLSEASMPKLKKLNIQGNKFTENGIPNINALRMNHIHVSYRTYDERQKDRKKK